MIDVVVAALLHNNAPEKPAAVRTELPQLFATLTVGAEGIVFGAEIPEPIALTHPLSVCVTEYVDASVTVIEVVVAALLQSNDPVVFVAVNKELPQLFVTFTTGADGIGFGAETPLATGLIHPLTACVTEYVAESGTVIEVVVALLLHNNEPVKFDAVNSEPPQLSVTVTTGAAGTVLGADIPLPAALVHPLIVCVTVYVAAFVTVIEVVVAVLLHNNDPVKFEAVTTELPQLSATVTVGGAGIVFGAAIPFPEGLVQPFPV